MPTENIGFPLPIMVNGFACMTAEDIGLAKWNVDPEHPRSGPYDRFAETDPTRYDERRTEEAKAEAATRSEQVVGYTPGAVLTAPVTTGVVMSIEA
jgi:hypothetical protein